MAFTKNFAAMFGDGYGTGANGSGRNSIERFATRSLTFNEYNPASTSIGGVVSYFGLCIGYSDKELGDATAEYERYNLDGVINSGLTPIVATNNSNNGNLIWTFNQVIANRGTDTVKINEIGLFGTGSDGGEYQPFLLYYKRLNQAVVLNPGETKSFTLVINFESFCVKDTVATI